MFNYFSASSLGVTIYIYVCSSGNETQQWTIAAWPVRGFPSSLGEFHGLCVMSRTTVDGRLKTVINIPLFKGFQLVSTIRLVVQDFGGPSTVVFN